MLPGIGGRLRKAFGEREPHQATLTFTQFLRNPGWAAAAIEGRNKELVGERRGFGNSRKTKRGRGRHRLPRRRESREGRRYARRGE